LGLRYDKSYHIEKCVICGEDLKVVLMTAFGIKIYPRNCKCKRYEYKMRINKEKTKEKQIRVRRIISNSMMSKTFRSYTFKNWDHNVGNEKLFKIGRSYVKNFAYMKRENQGILIYGQPGNGKTFFSACIANALLKKMVSVICVGAIALVERINESKKNWGDEGIFTVLNALDNADLLIIDDFGTEMDNKWTRAIMYQVIEKRNSSNLPVIITTNIDINNIKERYDYRTYSRLSQMCTFIQNCGEDIRKIHGKHKTSEFLNEIKEHA